MTPSSLHPEDLLDRARRGRLTTEETKLLDAHVKECAACALERHDDFEAELEPEPTDDALLDRVIDRAIDAERAPPRRNLRWQTLLVAAAAVLIAAAAIAGAVQSRARKQVILPPVTLVPLASEVSQPAPPSANPTPETTEPIAAPPAPSAGHVPTASELFSRATQARRDKNDAEAIRLYRELQRHYPDSREANASRVVLGQLLLDRTDPDKALAEFDGYLKEGKKGAVTEEALVGRALALQKLGRRDEERAAWQELLAKFPNSVHAARARERLNAP